jgi:hypothetical protein
VIHEDIRNRCGRGPLSNNFDDGRRLFKRQCHRQRLDYVSSSNFCLFYSLKGVTNLKLAKSGIIGVVLIRTSGARYFKNSS